MLINGFPRSAISCPRQEVERMLLHQLHQRPSLGAARPTHSQPMSSAWRGARESPGGERKGGEGLRKLVLPAAPGMETGSARGMKTPALTPQQWTTWFALIIRCRITTNLRKNSEKTSTETSHGTQEETARRKGGGIYVLEDFQCARNDSLPVKASKVCFNIAALQIRTLGVKPPK